MKSILITGGTGMVGRNIQQSFMNHNMSGHFVGRNNGNYDLLDRNKTKKLFEDTKPNIVIHAGANCGGVEFNLNNSGTLIRDNMLMGINVLDACVKYKVQQVYITATCCSYPLNAPIPIKETDLWNGFPEKSNSGYGIGKKAIMKMSQDYREQFGLRSTCFILANLYGYFDNYDPNKSHVVPALIRKFLIAKENNDAYVECFGTGTASRDLFFSLDLADTFTRLISTNFDYAEPINLGSGKETTIKQLAELIAEIIDYKGQIVFNGKVSDGQPRRLLDISLAKKLFNYNPTTDLKTGLQKTIEWYRQNRS